MLEIVLIFIPSFWGVNIDIANKAPQLPNLVKASFETYQYTQQTIDLDDENEVYQDLAEQL